MKILEVVEKTLDEKTLRKRSKFWKSQKAGRASGKRSRVQRSLRLKRK